MDTEMLHSATFLNVANSETAKLITSKPMVKEYGKHRPVTFAFE
jgi:hypothetical protein